MRLAIVVNGFPTLSETFIYNKAVGLRAAGVDVTVLAHGRQAEWGMFAGRTESFPRQAVQRSLLAQGWAGLPARWIRVVFKQPRQSLHLWKAARTRYEDVRRAFMAWVLALPLETGHYDVVHFGYSGLAALYLDALPLLSARLFTSCRGAAEQIVPLVNPQRGEQLRQVFGYMQRVHCVSAEMQRTVEKYGLCPGQGFVNHPAIDAAQFQRRTVYLQKAVGPYHLVSVGRLHWKKGLEFGLLTVRQLVDDGLDVTYDIIGGGDEEEKLRYAVADLGLSQRVRLLGRQSAAVVREALETADVCLLPSLSEGLSNAALEAMAMEVPIVSTTAGGMDEAITDGVEGFLVPPWQPGKMAEKVCVLLADPALRLRMGQAGRQRVIEHFQLERQICCFLEQYQEVKNAAG